MPLRASTSSEVTINTSVAAAMVQAGYRQCPTDRRRLADKPRSVGPSYRGRMSPRAASSRSPLSAHPARRPTRVHRHDDINTAGCACRTTPASPWASAHHPDECPRGRHGPGRVAASGEHPALPRPRHRGAWHVFDFVDSGDPVVGSDLPATHAEAGAAWNRARTADHEGLPSPAQPIGPLVGPRAGHPAYPAPPHDGLSTESVPVPTSPCSRAVFEVQRNVGNYAGGRDALPWRDGS